MGKKWVKTKKKKWKAKRKKKKSITVVLFAALFEPIKANNAVIQVPIF